MKIKKLIWLLLLTMVGCTGSQSPVKNDPWHPAAFARADVESQRGYDLCLSSAKMHFDVPVVQEDREYRDRQWRDANFDCELHWLPINFNECIDRYKGTATPTADEMESLKRACISYPNRKQ
jgi:hypothetical protein